MTIKELPDFQLFDQIQQLQAIQKKHAPKTAVWLAASEKLVPLFAEMKRRYPSGRVGPAV